MRTLRWSSVCPGGEALHVAFVEQPERGNREVHGHDFFEVFLVDSGRGYHLLGSESRQIPLVAGQMIFIRSRDIHGFRAAASAEPFTLINVAFSRRSWMELRDRYRLGQFPVFDERVDDPPVQEFTGSLFREVTGQFRALLHEERSAIARDGFLLGLARKLGGEDSLPGLAAVPAWMRRGMLLASKDTEGWKNGVPGLARHCGCSTGHLARSMKKHLGKSPSDWLLAIRLQRAAQLLESTGFSVAEVALEAGFENLSHFHRCFLRSYQTTPRLYRKKHFRDVL